MFTIVPRRATHTGVEILVVALWQTARPRPLELTVESQVPPFPVDDWQRIDGGRSQPIYYWTRRIDGLEPNCSYAVRLVWGREQLARARFETLPEQLPHGDSGAGPRRPFTLWLSSCFAARQVKAGLGDVVEEVFASPRLRPHVNCLVGDQVYLDELSLAIFVALSKRRLRTRFNDQYAYTFGHPEFSQLLSSAANRFLADDHEIWNNYPHNPFGIPLRSKRFWRSWFELAHTERCVPLQAPESVEGFEIGKDLSLCMADFRLGRSEDGIHFAKDRVMDRVHDWLKGLRCPGVLITQQPVISPRGTGGDRKLPDYREYWCKLLPALHSCPQSLVVLAGDVHHGHVACTQIGGDTDERRLIQIVASPLALVNPVAASSPLPELSHFPSATPTGDPRPIDYPLRVPTLDAERHTVRSEDHAMTISFWRNDVAGRKRLGMRVRTWLTRAASTASAPSWETTLPF